MIQLMTPITIATTFPQIEPHHRVVFCGSCFAGVLGDFWKKHHLAASVNECGIVFNPMSMLRQFHLIESEGKSDNLDLREDKQCGWISLDFHRSFYAASKEELQCKLQQHCMEAKQRLEEADYLILTWGTAFGWYHCDRPETIVANCHRLPGNEFSREIHSYDCIVAQYREWLTCFLQRNPKCKVIISVSPVRHLRQGSNENSISKAHLLLAAEQLCREFDNRVFYFPAYELMMDELRDYRFYADDLVHPSEKAKEIIIERFLKHVASENLQRYVVESNKLVLREQHRSHMTMEQQYNQDLIDRRADLRHRFGLK